LALGVVVSPLTAQRRLSAVDGASRSSQSTTTVFFISSFGPDSLAAEAKSSSTPIRTILSASEFPFLFFSFFPVDFSSFVFFRSEVWSLFHPINLPGDDCQSFNNRIAFFFLFSD
jgi:hypothetical protein